MEKALIDFFLIGSGAGCGYGSGDGSGYGYGDGYGYGSGAGAGSVTGTGYGDGYGSGDGDGYGYGYGSGAGSGSGYGYGYGSGSGASAGYDDGTGYGDGYGSSYGSGDGISIQIFKGKKIYVVDNIPCYFVKVHDNFAEVRTIDKNTFEETKVFIGKYNGYFAHGSTIREAIEDAMKKCFNNLNFKEVKNRLLAEFQEKRKLTVKELYQWHGLLTGSCRFGRSEFQKQHNLKDDDKLSLEEFVELTEDAFNGEKIRDLLK